MMIIGDASEMDAKRILSHGIIIVHTISWWEPWLHLPQFNLVPTSPLLQFNVLAIRKALVLEALGNPQEHLWLLVHYAQYLIE
jgi:hypothetical protein